MECIIVYDDVITNEEVEKYGSMMLYNCPFFYGERDNPSTQPSGMVCDFTEINIPELHEILENLLNKIKEKCKDLKDCKLYRTYLNLFLPGETPSFHIDGENTVTCLYYINPNVNPNEGGETQFLIDNQIKGVMSKPGRLVVFDGNIEHRATSFTHFPRMTLAFKFKKNRCNN
jgi:Rps23 Pro-64 3,4-dihydroxylase Tpa1-like proline 4-hydroxylase